jgi:hypothetical protein
VIVPAVLLAVGALVTAPIVVQASKDSAVATANAADSATAALPSVGRVETCVVDAYSGCTVLHGFGQKPAAIVATAAGPATLSIDPSRTTDTSFRLRALRFDGQRYSTGTKLRYTAHYDFAAAPPQPTTPAPSTTTAPTQPPTSSTPSPTATTTSPTKPPASSTPTPTATTTPTTTTSTPPTSTPTTSPTSTAGTCTNPVWTSSANFGQWSTNGFLVNNNKWNTAEAGPQTIRACGYNRWSVVSDQPELASNPGSVKTYPDTQKNFNQSIDSFNSIKSTFANTAPASGEWNFAYDIWLNGLGNDELMIWTNYRYPGSLPPGNAAEKTTVTIDGQQYVAWRHGSPGSRYIALAMGPQKSSGSVDVLKIMDWLVSKGWLSGSDRVSAIEYGVEISSTNGPQTFHLNDYSLTTS